jgi:hypothetical protein
MTRSRLQFRRTFRNFVLVFLFVLISEKQQPLFAIFDKAVQGIGLASDIYSLYGDYAGKTTLYPGYALHSWRNDYYGYYRNIKFVNHGRITRNPSNGDYQYELRSILLDGTGTISRDSFPLNYLRRREYRCDQSIPAVGWEPEVKFVYNELEDFVLAFFHASPPQKLVFMRQMLHTELLLGPEWKKSAVIVIHSNRGLERANVMRSFLMIGALSTKGFHLSIFSMHGHPVFGENHLREMNQLG